MKTFGACVILPSTIHLAYTESKITRKRGEKEKEKRRRNQFVRLSVPEGHDKQPLAHGVIDLTVRKTHSNAIERIVYVRRY